MKTITKHNLCKGRCLVFQLTVCLTLIAFTSCKGMKSNPQNNPSSDVNASVATENTKEKHTLFEKEGRTIFLERDSGFTLCYATTNGTTQAITLPEFGSEGALGMVGFVSPDEKFVYVAADMAPQSNGWITRFHLYQIEIHSINIKHVDDCAAIHFDNNGFRIAKAEQMNPEVHGTANEIWMLRDVYYNFSGQKIRKSEEEYTYDDLIKAYGDNLVNADGFPYSR